MKKIILFILVILVVVSCENTNKIKNHDITNKTGGTLKELPNSNRVPNKSSFSSDILEIDKQIAALISNNTESSYRKALLLADKAIKLDSMFYPAYVKKAFIFTKLSKYKESIEIYTHVVTELKPDYIELYTMLGMLYEKVGDKNKAIKYYEKTIKKYSERISKDNDILDMINKAHISYILDNEKGLNEIDSLIKQYPEKKDLPMYREYMFIQYNHKTIISDL